MPGPPHEPRADRPHLPGYGVETADAGLLPWRWAVERLERAYGSWLATTSEDGRPHVAAVWTVWLDDAPWFSSGLRSRKARNLARDPHCVLTTDDTREPVIVEGVAEVQREPSAITAFAAATTAKYDQPYDDDFFDPDVNGVWKVVPVRAFGLIEAEFTSSPTRWTFDH